MRKALHIYLNLAKFKPTEPRSFPSKQTRKFFKSMINKKIISSKLIYMTLLLILSQDDCTLNFASMLKVMSRNKKKYHHHVHLMDKT